MCGAGRRCSVIGEAEMVLVLLVVFLATLVIAVGVDAMITWLRESW